MLSRRLAEAGWPSETPVCVVSRAGWPDQLVSEHDVGTLSAACVLHAGRPAVVTVGVGARPVLQRRRQGSGEAADKPEPEPSEVDPAVAFTRP